MRTEGVFKVEIKTNPTENPYKNVTLNDVQLASVYYPILIDLAKHKHCCTYGELVDKAKERRPNKVIVKNAIAISVGRKLDVVSLFCEKEELPDLTCLIINKTSGEVGSGFLDDPVATREEVFAFDWSAVSTDFDGFIKHTESDLTPRKKIKEPEALKMMSAFYTLNKDKLPTSVKDKREAIIRLLMEGSTAEEAFLQATGASI